MCKFYISALVGIIIEWKYTLTSFIIEEIWISSSFKFHVLFFLCSRIFLFGISFLNMWHWVLNPLIKWIPLNVFCCRMTCMWPLSKTETFYHTILISKEYYAIVVTSRHYSGLHLKKLQKISISFFSQASHPSACGNVTRYSDFLVSLSS